MQRVGLNVRLVFAQAVEDVHGLPYPAWDEMRKEGDVGIADVIIGNATIASVANMALRQ